ncbi:MAG: FAD-dependent thymidylate synthase [Patescibacteria group bacterium]|jgi:thymidylate synthase (FAD)
MKIVEPSVEVFWTQAGLDMLLAIERAGRTSYKSEGKITDGSSEPFVRMLLKRGHYSVFEHCSVSARVVTDRGVSHEIVRHRLASYTQESTRFCNYAADRFGQEVTFCLPSFFMQGQNQAMRSVWDTAIETAEMLYFEMLKAGARPEQARSVLPNSTKTEIMMTMNLREWRHFFHLRTAQAAHPDMRLVASLLLDEFRQHVPAIFEELGE